MQTFRAEFAMPGAAAQLLRQLRTPKRSSSPFLAARTRLSPAEALVSEALVEGASELRLESGRKSKRLYRIDGLWHAQEPLVEASFRTIRAELAQAARLRLEGPAPQDGALRLGALGDRAAHVQIVPTADGELLALRMLDGASRPLEAFGFLDEDLARVRSELKRPGGLFVVAGPNDSGKTALLHALANEAGAENALCIERRPEADLDAACQLRRLPADRLFRAATDDGVDLVSIDELNDETSAAAAKGALATGKKVLLGLANGEASRTERFSSSLRALLQPRLFRTVCEACASDRAVGQRHAGLPEEAAEELFGGASQWIVREGAKCAACRWTGFRGRTAATAARFFPASGAGPSPRAAAWAAVRNGRTSLNEAVRVLFPH